MRSSDTLYMGTLFEGGVTVAVFILLYLSRMKWHMGSVAEFWEFSP